MDERFFDSRDYRCCFNVFHAKIGTFVFCTWLLHEIVLATLFLLSRKEFKDGQPTPGLVVVLVCRLLQIPTVAILYVGLWRHRRRWILPFAVVQVRFSSLNNALFSSRPVFSPTSPPC